MHVGDAALTSGAFALALGAIELAKVYARKRAAKNGNSPTAEIAQHMQTMAAAAKQSAEASDHIRDALIGIKQEQAILLRTIEREVIPHLKQR